MVTAVSSPLTDYLNFTANKSALLAAFQKTPTYTQAVSNYQSAITSITNVDQFLGNYKVLQFALQAYGLDSAISETGFLKKILTEDPTQTTSLAQRSGDPRLVAFAKAFWSLSSDGGAATSSPTGVNAVVAQYTNVQFGQWVANNDQDPALATALTAQQTFQDSIDISNVGALFAQYKQSPGVQAATAYYQNNIKTVTSPAALLADPKLLNVALTAYGIDPSSISTATVQQLLTQNPTDANSAASNNTAYQAFAHAFSSLNTDGGAGVSSASSISAVISNYQTVSFQNAVASNSQSANTALFGATGAQQIATLQSDFQNQSGVAQTAAYFTANTPSNLSVSSFVNNPQLLQVALVAYGLGPTSVSAGIAQLLLTQNPSSSTSLVAQASSELPFVNALQAQFSGSNGGFQASAATHIAALYQQNEFKASIGSDLTQAQAQTTSNASTGTPAGAPLSDYQIIADKSLSAVVDGAFNEPASLGALDPTQQVNILTNSGFNPANLTQPNAVPKLMEQYLVNQDQSASGSTDPILSLFQSGAGSGSAITPLDLSSLYSGGSSSGASTNWIVSLFN